MTRIERIANLPLRRKAEVLKDLAACGWADLPDRGGPDAGGDGPHL
jgi:hypothetical protein